MAGKPVQLIKVVSAIPSSWARWFIWETKAPSLPARCSARATAQSGFAHYALVPVYPEVPLAPVDVLLGVQSQVQPQLDLPETDGVQSAMSSFRSIREKMPGTWTLRKGTKQDGGFRRQSLRP